jgi:hypothetical protein
VHAALQYHMHSQASDAFGTRPADVLPSVIVETAGFLTSILSEQKCENLVRNVAGRVNLWKRRASIVAGFATMPSSVHEEDSAGKGDL